MSTVSRRRFLKLSAAASVVACQSSPTVEKTPNVLPYVPLSKQPYVQIIGAGRVRLRFETKEARALPVTLNGPNGFLIELTPAMQEDELSYEWQPMPTVDVVADEPGLHVLQEVTFGDLIPGETYAWSIELGGEQAITGHFKTPPPVGTSFRLAFTADTMFPNTDKTFETMSMHAPDFLIHGGDYVYQTNPNDTWMDFSTTMAALSSSTLLAMTVGNHEYEEMDEVHVMYDRLYMPQGDSGDHFYNAYTYAGFRFIHLDTESAREGMPDKTVDMMAWCRAELEKAVSESDIIASVIVMHRPMFTLGKYFKDNPTDRDAWHALFVEFGVRLVFCGHSHSYERFLVDGITYIVDGGGGALLYNPIQEKEHALTLRPEEVSWQMAYVYDYGFCIIDVDEFGVMSLSRIDSYSGEVSDTAVF